MPKIRSICFLLLLPLALGILAVPADSSVRVGISISIAPPPLPVYVQPVCPGADYIWVPGYWAYGADGYFWVPGTWVMAPEPGLLWTPGYWGWISGAYVWNAGYWGPHVGFYGGIDYGFGYTGVGYDGGYWHDSHFFYNRSVNHIDPHVIHNTYSRHVPGAGGAGRVSFNGGRGGATARPTGAEQVAAREHHVAATSTQVQQRRKASADRSQFAAVNRGKPAVAATAKPEEFSGHGAVAARAAGGRYVPAASHAAARAPANLAERATRPAEARSKPTARENKPVAPATRENRSVAAHPAPARVYARPAPSRTASRPAPATHVSAPRPERTMSRPAPRPEPQRATRVAPRRPSTPSAHASHSPAQHGSAAPARGKGQPKRGPGHNR